MAKVEAPRMNGIKVQTETIGPEANIREYVGLLWVVVAAALGVSLLCVPAGIALQDPNSAANLRPRSIMDIAIANVNTAAALTVEAFSGVLTTPTIVPSDTATFNPTFTFTASFTSTVIASRTSIPPTITRRPGQGQGAGPVSPNTPIVVPTQTNSPLPPPTLTSAPIQTSTPIPPPTISKTPKPTKTPVPPPTTDVPPPTTDVPPPTTDVPPPTTEPPPATPDPPPPTTDVPPPTTEPPPATTEPPPPTVGTP